MTAKDRIGWKFPSNDGGQDDGYSDPGIETYAGKLYSSLAREVIQNSLDAKLDNGKLTVCFELEQCAPEELPGRDELFEAIEACRSAAQDSGTDESKRFFERASSLLRGKKKIDCLKIQDYNTHGLRGEDNDRKGEWHALIKSQGRSFKGSNTAGGSFGIGKNAPFAISELRTVFYSTHYLDGQGNPCERAQGKAILESYETGPDEMTQGTGFWGQKEGCRSILKGKGVQFPSFLKREFKGKATQQGTTLWIPALIQHKNKDWGMEIAAAVVSNFFYAIHKDFLDVLVGIVDVEEINSETLPSMLENQKLWDINEEVKHANSYFKALTEGSHKTNTSERFKLKPCKLSILVDDGLPCRVAILRNTGMLITDQLPRLKQWNNFNDFSAVCICEGDEGNALLRNMENPQHNEFEPDRLRQNEAEGRKALKQLAKWVKEEIKKEAYFSSEKTDDVDEITQFLGDDSEQLNGEQDEQDLEGLSRKTYKPKPKRVKPAPPAPNGGGEGGGGSGGGGGGGGGGGAGGKRPAIKQLEVRDIRILQRDLPQRKTVMFTPIASGSPKLSFAVAGDDSSTERISVVKWWYSNTPDVKPKKAGEAIDLTKDKRASIDVELSHATEDALCLILEIPPKS